MSRGLSENSPIMAANRTHEPRIEVTEPSLDEVNEDIDEGGQQSGYLFWGRGENSPKPVNRRFHTAEAVDELKDMLTISKDRQPNGDAGGTLNKGFDLSDTNSGSDDDGSNIKSDDDDNDGDECDGDSCASYEDIKDANDLVYNERYFEGESEKYGELAFMRRYRYGNLFMLLVRFCCAISVLSVCMNTPVTFIDKPALRYVTLLLDIIIACILLLEMGLKMKFKGLVHAEHSYLRSPGRLFELFMLIVLIISFVLQIVEVTSSLDKQVSNYLLISLVRIPRPLLLVRTINTSDSRFRLPRNIINEYVTKVGEITLYMLYSLLVFALIGGQLFGVMDFFCVKNMKTITNVTYDDLTYPIRRCPLTGDDAFCPENYNCTKLEFSKRRQHDQYFDNIASSFLTTYEAMSLEGWSFKMFETMELLPDGMTIGFIYFFLLVVIVGMLGRNIFIAIITEVFADIRVELEKISQQMEATTQTEKEKEDLHVLHKVEGHVRMINVGEEHVAMSKIRLYIFRFVKCQPFFYFIHIAILVDALIQAFACGDEDDIYWPAQIAFTVLFDIECLLKLIGMGFKGYIHTSAFQGIVAIGSTILLPLVVLGYREYAFFQVARLFRLPMLVGSVILFVRRILGSSKKISQFAMFTLFVLVISAGIFLQLYCGFGLEVSTNATNATFVPKDDFGFHTFPAAFKSTFQMFMQEAWTEVVNNMLGFSNSGLDVLVYVFLILFHLLAATMLVSLFVALILDNLELEEKEKIAKQKKIDEGVVQKTKKLPLRIRIFKWFKPQPKVVIKNISGIDHDAPVVRQTFADNFLEPEEVEEINFPLSSFENSVNEEEETPDSKLTYVETFRKSSTAETSRMRKQSSISTMMMQAQLGAINSSSMDNNIIDRKRKISACIDLSPNRKISNTNEINAANRKISGVIAPAPILRQTSRTQADNLSLLFRAGMFNQNRKKTDVSAVKQEREEAQLKQEMEINTIRENFPRFDKSIFIFSSRNKLRKFIHKIFHARYRHTHDTNILGAFSIHRLKKYFETQTYLEWGMIVITQISLIGMIIEFNNEHIGIFHDQALFVIELIFIVASTIEIVLKLIADGLLFAPDGLISDFGDVLHLLIYIVSLIYDIWQPAVIKRFSGAYALLVLRCLRPIRLITQCLPLRREVWQVVRGYKDLLKVIFLFAIFLFCFASYGVQAFGHKLKKCNDASIKNESYCVGFFVMMLAKPSLISDLNGTTSILVPRVWKNPRTFDFDDMGHAILVLLEMLSLEGWTEIRDTLEPIDKPWGMIYPHLYVFLAGLVALTLLIGIIVSNYNESKGTALLTVEQKRWKDLKSKLKLTDCLRLPPVPIESNFRHALYDIVLGKWYNRVYFTVIILNSLTLVFGQWHHSEHANYQSLALEVIGIICSVIFVIDTLIKFYAFSVKGYFVSYDNWLDFLLMLGGVAFIVVWSYPTCNLDAHVQFKDTWTCDVSRRIGIVVFILRFLTIAVKHNALRMLMMTIIMGVYKSVWTFFVMGLIIFTYAYIGIIFFGSVKRGVNLNRNVNFEDFRNAMFLLIRIMTGEDWNSLMHDVCIQPPYCRIDPDNNYWESNCGNKPLAYLYFHTFTIIITYFLLNVLTGVIIDNFSIFYLSDQDSIMSHQDITLFQGAWNVVDKHHKGFVNALRARFCLRLVYEKLDLNKPLVLKRMFQEIEQGQSDKMTFHNLLFIIAYKKINNMTKALQLEELLKREEYDRVIREETAAKIITDFMYYVIRRLRSQKDKKRRFGKSLSVTTSLYSLGDDFGEDSDEELFPSFPRKAKRRQMSRRVRIVNTNVNESARRTERKAMSSGFYSWWDDELGELEDKK